MKGKKGSDYHMYSTALRQSEKDLPRPAGCQSLNGRSYAMENSTGGMGRLANIFQEASAISSVRIADFFKLTIFLKLRVKV